MFRAKAVGRKQDTFCIQRVLLFMFVPFVRSLLEIRCRKTDIDRQPGRPQVVKWRMCFACWLTKAIDTHSDYVTLIALPLQE